MVILLKPTLHSVLIEKQCGHKKRPPLVCKNFNYLFWVIDSQLINRFVCFIWSDREHQNGFHCLFKSYMKILNNMMYYRQAKLLLSYLSLKPNLRFPDIFNLKIINRFFIVRNWTFENLLECSVTNTMYKRQRSDQTYESKSTLESI